MDLKQNYLVDTTCRQEQMYNTIFGNLRMEKYERELENLNEKYLNDQKTIQQILNQMNDIESLVTLNKSLTRELNAKKLEDAKLDQLRRNEHDDEVFRRQVNEETVHANLRMENVERKLNLLHEQRLNDAKRIDQVSNQINGLIKDKNSLIKVNKIMTNELNTLKAKLEEVECIKHVRGVPRKDFNAFKMEMNFRMDRIDRSCESYYNTIIQKYNKLKARLGLVERQVTNDRISNLRPAGMNCACMSNMSSRPSTMAGNTTHATPPQNGSVIAQTTAGTPLPPPPPPSTTTKSSPPPPPPAPVTISTERSDNSNTATTVEPKIYTRLAVTPAMLKTVVLKPASERKQPKKSVGSNPSIASSSKNDSREKSPLPALIATRPGDTSTLQSNTPVTPTTFGPPLLPPPPLLTVTSPMRNNGSSTITSTVVKPKAFTWLNVAQEFLKTVMLEPANEQKLKRSTNPLVAFDDVRVVNPTTATSASVTRRPENVLGNRRPVRSRSAEHGDGLCLDVRPVSPAPAFGRSDGEINHSDDVD